MFLPSTQETGDEDCWISQERGALPVPASPTTHRHGHQEASGLGPGRDRQQRRLSSFISFLLLLYNLESTYLSYYSYDALADNKYDFFQGHFSNTQHHFRHHGRHSTENAFL